MSLLTNQIGVHQFIALKGDIIPPAQTKVVDDRPGIDGSEFMLTGVKGRPFTLISVVDCESYEDAHNTLVIYQREIDGDAVEIIQGGVSGDSNGYRVVVLNVEGSATRLAGAVGYGFSSAAQGLLTARWDLIAVPIED